MASKTSKWKKKGVDEGVKPHEAPELTMVEKQEGPPEPKEYFPLDQDGQPKNDKYGRIMVMIDKETGALLPVLWFNLSIIECGVTTAEANRILATEVAMAVMRREAVVVQERERAVLNVLERFGIMGDEPAETPEESEIIDGQ